jgi:hypothetical protein
LIVLLQVSYTLKRVSARATTTRGVLRAANDGQVMDLMLENIVRLLLLPILSSSARAVDNYLIFIIRHHLTKILFLRQIFCNLQICELQNKLGTYSD